ncbi:hypothetical protein E2P64_06635, partial [Candidatus Bathyarchaeota archaeon]
MPITEGGRFTPHDRIVSPGVFSRENDLSGIAQGVADIGAVIVAPFAKGPGFSPTLVNSVGELEDKFGIADGTYYGPYTAAEYLKEKGFVTVCRVGALTGYHQTYPFVIYAEKGEWQRADDTGYVQLASSYVSVLSSSFVSSSNPTVATVSSSVDGWYTGSGFTGTFKITGSLTVTFAAGPGSASFAAGAGISTGSVLYYGQQATIGTLYAEIALTNVTTSYVTSSYPNPINLLNQLVLSSSITGSIANYSVDATLAGEPWNNGITLTPSSSATNPFISQSLGECASVVYKFFGPVHGKFGPYTGEFTSAGTPTFDACS